MKRVMKKEPCIHQPGETVEVTDMLQARDGRAAAQKKLLLAYGQPLLCFTMNIPGPIKTSLLIRLGFLEGIRRLENALTKAEIPILYTKRIAYKTGYEQYYVLKGDAREIKKIAARIENQDRVGRLFDMDVLDVDGRKLSRTELGMPGRLCLVCDEAAQVCARSRKHAVPVLVRKIHRTLWEMLQGWTEKALLDGLLGEVYATPKPGLVDRDNSGAHKDMNVETFEKSTQAILPYLLQMGEKGWEWDGTGTELFTALRPLGAAAEKAMFFATNNVNTHKGIIFSLGLVTSFGLWQLAQTGRFDSEAILRVIGQSVTPVLEKDFAKIDPFHPHTHGEMLFIKHGIRGIRGEAMDGFPAVQTIALPMLRQLRQEGWEKERAYIQTLLVLVAQVEDSNIISRSDVETLHWAQKKTQQILALGGAATAEGLQAVWELNEKFIEKNISPGGCADLLILSIYLLTMEDRLKEKKG